MRHHVPRIVGASVGSQISDAGDGAPTNGDAWRTCQNPGGMRCGDRVGALRQWLESEDVIDLRPKLTLHMVETLVPLGVSVAGRRG
jgi:hypothetical protein